MLARSSKPQHCEHSLGSSSNQKANQYKEVPVKIMFVKSNKSNFKNLIMSLLCRRLLTTINRPLSCALLLLCCTSLLKEAESTTLDLDPQTLSLSTNGVPLSKIANPIHELSSDAFADPPEFIRSRKFKAEVHYVKTKDNYMLTMHRIVNPLVPKHLRSKLKPVLLHHGLFGSSYNFIIASDRNNDRPRFDARDLVRTWPLNVYTPQAPFSWQKLAGIVNDLTLSRLYLTQPTDRWLAPQISDSLGFQMANEGYDVWMGNSRGSTYSLNHTKYDWHYDWRYWDFSFHEMGLFDLPAEIDYILEARQRKSLAYIGHSQGNLIMFILQSFHPEWRHKVKPFIALSPIAYVPNVYHGAMRVLIRLIEKTLITSTKLNRVLKGRVLANDPLTSQGLDLICLPKWSTQICNLALSVITGDNLIRTNTSMLTTVAHHIPEGTSVLNILHYGQLVVSGQFRAFDFGPKENLLRYGQHKAPFYPMERIKSPDIAFIVGLTDTLSTPINVQLTKDKLTVPLLDEYTVPDVYWGHVDHMYATGSGRLVGAHLIGLVDRYRLVDV